MSSGNTTVYAMTSANMDTHSLAARPAVTGAREAPLGPETAAAPAGLPI